MDQQINQSRSDINLDHLEKMIACKVGVAYARQYTRRIMDTSTTDIVKLMEQTVAAIGISISQAVTQYDIQVDENRAKQICDEALAAFMMACDGSHIICSDVGKIGN